MSLYRPCLNLRVWLVGSQYTVRSLKATAHIYIHSQVTLWGDVSPRTARVHLGIAAMHQCVSSKNKDWSSKWCRLVHPAYLVLAMYIIEHIDKMVVFEVEAWIIDNFTPKLLFSTP